MPHPLPAANLSFTLEPDGRVVIRLRSPFNSRLDDPPITSKIVSNVKSLAPRTEGNSNPIHGPPTGPTRFHGAAWYGFAALALLLILMTGLLAGLTLAVMSVDMTRLRVWTRTGGPKRQLVLQNLIVSWNIGEGMNILCYTINNIPNSYMYFQFSQFVLVCSNVVFTRGADINHNTELRLRLF